MTATPISSWYVVQTQVHAERKAAAHLNRQGFATYLPAYMKRRRHARQVQNVIAPLFPRYLFVAVDQSDAALAVHPIDDWGRPAGLQRCRACDCARSHR